MPGADRHIRDRTCVEHILRYCEQVRGYGKINIYNTLLEQRF